MTVTLMTDINDSDIDDGDINDSDIDDGHIYQWKFAIRLISFVLLV